MGKRRANGDGMVRRRADGRWEGSAVVGHKADGKPIFKSVFAKTQKELLPRLRQLIETYRGAELTEDSRMTLREWLDRWLDEYAAPTVRKSTIAGYRGYAKKICSYLGGKQVKALTTADVQRMYNKLKNCGREVENETMGRQLSDASVRSIHMLLHEAMDAAVREHLTAKNPTNGTTIPRKSSAPKKILDNAQLDTFMEAIKSEPQWHDFFYTEVTTGLRRGEICGLKWEDFDSENGRLNVRRSVSVARGGGLQEGETKTNSGLRSILLPQSTLRILKERRKTARTEWVFPNLHKPENPTSPSAAYQKLKAILKRANLPDIRFHDLRHTFATHALQSGVDPKTLAGILGHTNASFTLDTYTHVTSDMQRNAAAIVENFMEELLDE